MKYRSKKKHKNLTKWTKFVNSNRMNEFAEQIHIKFHEKTYIYWY